MKELNGLISCRELMTSYKAPTWLIDKWIREDGTMMLYGASGVGKSFLALDWALSIATPKIRDWCGMPIKHGKVVYFVGEGFGGIYARVLGWRCVHNISEDDVSDITFYPSPLDLDKETFQLKDKPDLVIIDTLNRYNSGDENSSQDTRNMMNNCSQLGKSVLFVHHEGKDKGKGGRGSSAWRAGMDMEFACEKKDTGKLIVTQSKSKDDEPQEPIVLDMKKVHMEAGGVKFTTLVPHFMMRRSTNAIMA